MNESFSKNFIDSLLDLFIIKSKPLKKLDECLNSYDEKALKLLYFSKNAKNGKNGNELGKEELVKRLRKRIIKDFEGLLNTLSAKEIVYLQEEYKNAEFYNNIEHIIRGFMFYFEYDDEFVSVIPEELLELYNSYVSSDLKRENEYKEADMIFVTYLIANGVIEKDFIMHLIKNEYKININDDYFDKYYDKFCLYKDKYYAVQEFSKMDELIDAKKSVSVRVLSRKDIVTYSIFIKLLSDELAKINKGYVIDNFIFDACLQYKSLEEIRFSMLNTKETKKLKDYLFDKYDMIRYWALNGRTVEEFEREMLINNATLKSLPDDESLMSCINALNGEYVKALMDFYEVDNKNDLRSSIIKNAREIFEGYDDIELSEVLDMDYEVLNDLIDTNILSEGICYMYYENDEIHVVFPTEVYDVMMDILDKDYSDSVDILNNLVYSYMIMNGIIKKSQLKSLVEDFLGYELLDSDLDEAVEEVKAVSKEDYYSIFEDVSEELLGEKEKFGEYKKDISNIVKEEEFLEKLEEVVSGYLPLSSKVEEVMAAISYCVKDGYSVKDLLEGILSEYNVKLTDKQKKTIIDLYNKYKRYISVWKYNGYSFTEAQELKISSKNKVGRNDPCTCGSGKKYKKCCGDNC